MDMLLRNFASLLCLLFAVASVPAAETVRQHVRIDDDWKFSLGDAKDASAATQSAGLVLRYIVGAVIVRWPERCHRTGAEVDRMIRRRMAALKADRESSSEPRLRRDRLRSFLLRGRFGITRSEVEICRTPEPLSLQPIERRGRVAVVRPFEYRDPHRAGDTAE